MQFTKTLIGTSVAAAALGLLATAAPAMAAPGPLVSALFSSTVAPGATGEMAFGFANGGTDHVNFGSDTPGGIANPSTVTLTAPEHTTFANQTSFGSKWLQDDGLIHPGGNWQGQNCVLSNGNTTITCTIIAGANSLFKADYHRYAFTPLVTVDSSVAPGTVLTGGTGLLKVYNYMGSDGNQAGPTVGYVTGTIRENLLTGTSGPGAPIYNTDSTVDIPGFGNPTATITIKDADGNTIGTATVNPDGSYDVKISAADAATASAKGPVQVTESDLPGTTWPVTIDVTKLGTPIVNPLVGGGIALAAAAGLGTVLLVRRRRAAVQA